MASNLYSFTSDEIKTRWREPFLTGGIAKMNAIVHPAGIYRGFRLAGTGNNCELSILPDGIEGDHVAVYRTTTGYALTLRHVGALTVDLTSLAGNDVVIAVYGSYAIGVTTVARVRAYTVSEYLAASEVAELVVVGLVTVSAGVPITVLRYDRRTMAAGKVAPAARPSIALLRNPSFEAGLPNDSGALAAVFWEAIQSGGTAVFRPSTAAAYDGVKSVAYNYTSGPATTALRQRVNMPVRAGALLRLTFAYRVDVLATAGTAEVSLRYLAANGSNVAGSSTAVPLTVTSGFVVVETTFAVPSGVTHLRDLSLILTGVTFGSTGDVVFFDAVQLSLCEPSLADAGEASESLARMVSASSLVLEDGAATPAYGAGALLKYLSGAWQGEPGVIASDKAGATMLLNLVGRIVLGSGLLGTDANLRKPRVHAPYGSSGIGAYTLMWESFQGGLGSVRLYVRDADGSIYLTHNAAWNGSLWARDTAARASLLAQTSQGIGVFVHASAGTATWADTFASATWGAAADFTDIGADITTALTLGASIPDTAAGAETARITTTRGVTPVRTLLWKMTGAVVSLRIYHAALGSPDETLEITNNARWDETASIWHSDSAAASSTKYSFATSQLTIFSRAASAGTWTDGYTLGGGWDEQGLAVLADQPDPPVASALPDNALAASLVPKAWGRVTTDGSGGVTVEGVGLSASIFLGLVIVQLNTPIAGESMCVAKADSSAISGWADAVATLVAPDQAGVSYYEDVSGTITLRALNTHARTFNIIFWGKRT